MLRERLRRPPAVLAPGAYDALSALLIERAGFEVVYLSGASIAYTQLGRPDVGLVSFDHLVDVTRRVCERVRIPVLVDADTGYGNALNVHRTVRVLERMGAAAVQIEDQGFPKRCGHFDEKRLISLAEMAGKVRAACDARLDARTLVVARTDAIAVEGFDAALERAAAYIAAGADVAFVEAPRTLEQMRIIVRKLGKRVPVVANMVEGGKTPLLTVADLSALGYRLVLSPGALVRALIPQLEEFLASLRRDGSTRAFRGPMTDLAGVNRRIGLEETLTQGGRYEAPPVRKRVGRRSRS